MPDHSSDRCSGRRKVLMVAGVHEQRAADLFHIVGASGFPGSNPRLLKRGQQHRRENRDDRDDHQELNQGESAFFHGFPFLSFAEPAHNS